MTRAGFERLGLALDKCGGKRLARAFRDYRARIFVVRQRS
jgi:hypothetical protein